MSSKNDIKSMVPLSKAVAAAIVDMHEDVGRVQQSFYHWGARIIKKLNMETLHTGLQKVTLRVNKSTRTATLPPGFETEKGVYIIDAYGKKIPLRINNSLVDEKNIKDVPCEDKCEKCNQNKAICEEMTITEDTAIVSVNGIAAQQTVIKKMYPDGKYYLETKTPVWDEQTDTIIYTTLKEFVTQIDLKPCGCIDDTEENIEKIKCCCYDVYCNYYAACDNSCSIDYGGYRIFEETGLIYFDKSNAFDKVYIEFWGSLPKINGQYYIPSVAFETVVSGIKFKYVENKRNVSLQERNWTFDRYRIERANMNKVRGQISLDQIINAIGLTPKFDLNCDLIDINCGSASLSNSVVVSSASSAASVASGGSSVATGGNAVSCPTPPKTPTPFQLAVIAGMGAGTPILGVNYYQHNSLKDAMNLNMIIVDNQNETVLANQFTFDPATGTIYRWQGDGVTPNNWLPSNVLVVNFSKLI